MKRKKSSRIFSVALALTLATTAILPSGAAFAAGEKYTVTNTGNGYSIVTQTGGETLGYSNSSGISLITKDGYAFKDLNQNNALDPYEDWRLDTDTRAADLADRMTADRAGIESIAGLMLYSGHQKVPGGSAFGGDTYGGKTYAESGANAWDLSDGQKAFLQNDNLRHVLITSVESPQIAAKWSNNVQAFVEGIGFGIPANTSSDPRHAASGNSTVEYTAGQGGTISQWPSSMGMTATFDPDLVKQFGQIASTEYRALGIATALSPQIDLATEPRWSRVNGTFGENSALATDLSRAYIDGFQTTYSSDGTAAGWGSDSVNAMVKHWPSGGPEEAGRDGHYGFGKFAVYPGNNFDEQLLPFTQGAFKLADGTGSASAVMPYYTISYNQDTTYDENVGNGFSRYIISDLLRGKYNYDGVVCTDWMITADTSNDYVFSGKCWGVEDLTVTQRHFKALMAGVDQFGGNNVMGPVMGAYDLMVSTYGKTFADNRFADSARRLLMNIFNAGLFENSYLDPAESTAIVGNSDYMAAGYSAQLKSVVVVKNTNSLISKATSTKKTVYLSGVTESIASKFFNVTTDPTKADFAIVEMAAPSGGSGYSTADLAAGGNGYVPITLQYGAYTATTARDTAIANSPGTNFINSTTGVTVYTDNVANRSYKGKTVTASNVSELDRLQTVKSTMGSKPIVVYMKQSNPMVWSEVEPLASAIVIGYDIKEQAALEIISGTTEASGLLPMQQPANMQTVEAQYEDVPQDMNCYKDVNGSTYDFAFGLNWSGQIKDSRTAKYAGISPTPAPTVAPTAVPTVAPTVAPTTTPVNYQALLDATKVTVSSKTLYVGGNKSTRTIKVTKPAGAEAAVVSFKSNKISVATVSSAGKISAKKTGTAKIKTTITLNGLSKTVTTTVVVKKAYIKITASKKSIKKGSSFTFKVKAYGSSKAVSYSVSNKAVASIKSAKGKLTAKKKGKVTVTVKSGTLKKTFKVTIK